MNAVRLRRLLPAIAIVWMAWLNLFPIRTVDAHYHLAAGRWILEQRAVPTTGIFSGSFGDAPWHDNEWGFQALVAGIAGTRVDADGVLVLTQAGIVSLILLRALALAATLACLDAIFRRRGRSPEARATLLIVVGFLTFGNLFWTVRPQILSYLFLAATLWGIDRARPRGPQVAWPAIPLAVVWSNVHGMFILLPVLLAVEAVGAAIDGLRGRAGGGMRPALGWGALAAASCLAAGIHPYGFSQVLHPFRYLFEEGLVAGNAEWIRPDFLRLPLAVATAAVAAVGLAIRPRPAAADALRLIAFFGLATTALRHLPVASIVAVECIGRRSDAIADAIRGNAAVRSLVGSPSRRRAVLAAIALSAVAWSGAFTRSTARFVTWVPDFAFRPLRGMPEAEVRWLRRHGEPGAVFNSYRTGGFLMFRLYPDGRPVMDGRNDLHGAFRDEVYNPVRLAQPGWQTAWRRLEEELTIVAVLLEADDPLVARLEAQFGWIRVRPEPPTEGSRGWEQSDTVLLVPSSRASRFSSSPEPAGGASRAAGATSCSSRSRPPAPTTSISTATSARPPRG